MITCSDKFKTSVKADMRECKSKVVLSYNTPLVLTDEKIQSISINSSAEIALGDVQNDDITLTLMKNAITEEQFNKEIDIEILLGCVLEDGTEEYISVGTFESNGWGKNDKTGIVTINLTNKINSNAYIPKNIVVANGTDIRDYANSLISLVYGKTLEINSNVTKQLLNKSWLYHENVVDQLKALGIACNGLFRYVNGFELVPYKLTASSDTLKQGSNESILEVSRLSDYSKTNSNIQLLKSVFVESTTEKIASSTLKTEGGTSTDFELNTGCPTSVKYVMIGNEYGRLHEILNSITKCTVSIWDAYEDDQDHSIPVEVYGSKVESILKDKKNVTDGTVTYITNPYIQTEDHVSALTKAIYEGIRYKIKYRGNPCYQVGDTLTIDGLGNLLIYKNSLMYNGGLNGYLEGVLINEQ